MWNIYIYKELEKDLICGMSDSCLSLIRWSVFSPFFSIMVLHSTERELSLLRGAEMKNPPSSICLCSAAEAMGVVGNIQQFSGSRI